MYFAWLLTTNLNTTIHNQAVNYQIKHNHAFNMDANYQIKHNNVFNMDANYV